jgi:hypothetical protein
MMQTHALSLRLAIQWALLLIYVTASADGSGNKSKSWTLYHRIFSPGSDSNSALSQSQAEWTVRGSVELVLDPSADESATLKVTNAADSLPEPFAKELGATQTSWYQLKLVHEADGPKDSTDKVEIMASVPACNVRRANFRDEFVLQLQQGTAHALSMTYMPLVSPLAPATCAEYSSLPAEFKFESKASFDTAIPGMLVGKPPPKEPIVPTTTTTVGAKKVPPQNMHPPGLKWIPGASSRKQGAGGFVPPENQQEPGVYGFFKRYWYYIIPLLLIQIMGSEPPPPPPPTTGGAAAAAGAASTATAAVAKSSTGSTPPVRRRGKKE